MNQVIIDNYGAHLIYVESSTKFHPTNINRLNYQSNNNNNPPNKKNFVTAFEYVFPRKEQIVPVFSVSVYRPDFFVLWFNNVDEFNDYYHQIKHNCEFNIYQKNNLDEAVEFVKMKKRNKLKLIVTVDDVEFCKKIIDQIRKRHKKNFYVLFFQQFWNS